MTRQLGDIFLSSIQTLAARKSWRTFLKQFYEVVFLGTTFRRLQYGVAMLSATKSEIKNRLVAPADTTGIKVGIVTMKRFKRTAAATSN